MFYVICNTILLFCHYILFSMILIITYLTAQEEKSVWILNSIGCIVSYQDPKVNALLKPRCASSFLLLFGQLQADSELELAVRLLSVSALVLLTCLNWNSANHLIESPWEWTGRLKSSTEPTVSDLLVSWTWLWVVSVATVSVGWILG